MAAAALIAVGLLSVLTFAMLRALVELFRDVRQLRDALGLLDRPLALDIGPVAGTPPSRYGLPGQLDGEKDALLLFLSDRCSTCRVLAAALGGALPAGLWVVVEAATGQAAAAFIDTYRMTYGAGDGRVLVDPAGTVAERLGLKVTPAGYRIENGVFRDAGTVPSMRYLTSIMPVPFEAPVGV
jgi:hypothetical protein